MIRNALMKEIHQGSVTSPPPRVGSPMARSHGGNDVSVCPLLLPSAPALARRLHRRATTGSRGGKPPGFPGPFPTRGVVESSCFRHLHGPSQLAGVLGGDADDPGAQRGVDSRLELQRGAVV